MSQRELILKHLQRCRRKGITSAEAFTKYGVMDLPKRICELKAEGYAFKIEPVSAKNRYGKAVTFNKYTLQEAGK